MSTNLEGRSIVGVRPMTEHELSAEAWDLPAHQLPPPVIELDDGTIIYPSRDDAGNGPGCLFGRNCCGIAIRFATQETTLGPNP